MDKRSATSWILITCTAVLLAWAIYVGATADPLDDISVQISWYSGLWAFIAAAGGVLCGHWFISNCRTQRNIPVLAGWGVLWATVSLLAARVPVVADFSQKYSWAVFLTSVAVGAIFWPICRKEVEAAREESETGTDSNANVE